MFTPSRFSLARRYRGVSHWQIAQNLGVRCQTISDYEKGKAEPELAVIEKMAALLQFPYPFFSAAPIDIAEKPNSPALAKLNDITQEKMWAEVNIALLFNQWLDEYFTLPAVNFPDQVSLVPEVLAQDLREYWGMGELPIRSMFSLLESKGLRIFSLPTASIKSLSLWHHNRPIIFINPQQPAERWRFELARQLGYLLLNRSGLSSEAIDQAANTFASAFLMPRHALLTQVNHKQVSWHGLLALQEYWGVSSEVINDRLFALKVNSSSAYHRLWLQIGKTMRQRAPHELRIERSQLLTKVLRLAREKGISVKQIAAALYLYPAEITQLTFGLGMSVIKTKEKTKLTKTKSVPLQLVK